MLSKLDSYLKLLNETAVIVENEDKIRSLCSDIIACAKSEKKEETVLLCRKKLRQLQNEKCLNEKSEKEFVCTDFGFLCESLCTSAGILLTDAGKNLNFSSQKVFVYCNAETIIDAVLNLISNAAKFSKGKDITATVTTVGSQAVLKVENKTDGRCALDFHTGLRAVSHAAQANGGRFVLSSGTDNAKAVLALPQKNTKENYYRAPAFSSFLENTFSPVYIGLSDVFSHRSL